MARERRHSRSLQSEPRKIVSLQNDRVKAIRVLEMRKVRRETGLFVAEGASVLITAREAGHVPVSLVFNPDRVSGSGFGGLIAWALETGVEVLEVSEAVLSKLSSKDNPQAMLGVFKQRFVDLPPVSSLAGNSVWLALEEVRDPGNLGTIIRTVEGVGASGVVLVGNCCDPYSREAVRATMGSVFEVDLARVDRQAFLSWVENWGGDVVGLHLNARDDFRSVGYKSPTLVVMGGEGPGLSDALSEVCTRLVKIPMAGKLDSLNLSVACALTLYQICGSQLSV